MTCFFDVSLIWLNVFVHRRLKWMSLFNSSFSLFQNAVMYFLPFPIIYTSIVIVLVFGSSSRRGFTSLLCNGTTWLCLWWLKHKNTLEITQWHYLFSRDHHSVIVDVTQSLLGTVLWRNYCIFLMYHHAELLTDRNVNTNGDCYCHQCHCSEWIKISPWGTEQSSWIFLMISKNHRQCLVSLYFIIEIKRKTAQFLKNNIDIL